MGTQTMGSHGGGFGGGGRGQEPKSDALSRQGSLYNLTLDEVQNQLGDLGKPLSSMNLASATTLNRQSSLTLTRDLSKKTVDELWQDIKQGNTNSVLDRKAQERQPTLGEMTLEDFLVKAGVVAESSPGKKNAGPDLGIDPIALPQTNVSQHPHWMHYHIPSVQLHQQL